MLSEAGLQPVDEYLQLGGVIECDALYIARRGSCFHVETVCSIVDGFRSQAGEVNKHIK